jgi:hypothetical protein
MAAWTELSCSIRMIKKNFIVEDTFGVKLLRRLGEANIDDSCLVPIGNG